MQSYHDAQGLIHREFFMGERVADLKAAMDDRRASLEAEGATRFFRTKIGRNATCPCGSGRKFKKCCISGAALVGPARSR